MERKRFDCYGICVPAAALIAAVGGAQSAAMKLMAAGWLAGLISLGAADALRRAAGGMISRRKLLGAWLFSLLLAALTAAAGVLGAPWLAERLAMGAVEVKWWLGAAAARLIAAGARQIVLGHLSKENNFPELALRCTEIALQAEGIEPGVDADVRVALRDATTGMFSVCSRFD